MVGNCQELRWGAMVRANAVRTNEIDSFFPRTFSNNFLHVSTFVQCRSKRDRTFSGIYQVMCDGSIVKMKCLNTKYKFVRGYEMI